MLFNSQDFIFLFLPACLLLSYVANLVGRSFTGKVVLVVMSLAFYAYWRVDHLWVILVSLLVNYFGIRIVEAGPKATRKVGVAAMVIFNIAMISSFKYYNLAASTVHDITGMAVSLANVALPLGISFFSFQQIAYVVDFHRGGRRDDSFLDYALAVLFFPHLIAGPLVKYRVLIDQFSAKKKAVASDAAAETSANAPSKEEALGSEKTKSRLFSPTATAVAIGVTIFAIGLIKKVFFADNFAVYADPIFTAAEQGAPVSTTDAWIGAISFFFQIYFDFSGYTDMAIGLALFFGIRLPVNFLSPYMAKSIVEFWRRWHITLSSFLRDYVYISLGGNRFGAIRRYINLFLTMLIGGLWHGASWTFVAWGGLHGLYLVINHIYDRFRGRDHKPNFAENLFAQILTVFAVLMAWVYFRAETFTGAHRMFAEMFSINDFGRDTVLTYEHLASSLPGQFTRAFLEIRMLTFGPLTIWLALTGVAFVVVFLCANTYELFSKYHEAESEIPDSLRIRPAINLRWTPSVLWILFTAVILMIGLLSMTQVAQFIYFEF